jgi:PAS domain S-box-containing protein
MLIENAHEAITVIQDGTLKFVNASAERISGYSRHKLLSIPFLKFVHPDDRQMVQEYDLRLLQHKDDPATYDFRMVDAEGNHRWLRDNAVVIDWEARPATLNFLTDMTDQRVAEEGLRSYQEHLENLVEARTTALQEEVAERRRVEEQLRETNEQLRQANDSKDTFLTIISHDLRTPFTTLLGYAEMLTEHLDSLSQDHLHEGIWEIRRASERLYALLENLLTWARLQRGNMEHHPVDFDVSAYIRENVALFQSTAEQKQIAITNTVTTSIMAYADTHMMHTVLRNLLSNALKFTPTEGDVKIGARKIQACVYITVADSGIGMHAEEIDHVFHPDERITRRGTAGEKGTGLGLRLCHELIEQNGGTLSVESIPGQGTTFTFTIPARDA